MSRVVFQIRAKTETRCVSYIVVVTADRTEEFGKGRRSELTVGRGEAKLSLICKCLCIK